MVFTELLTIVFIVLKLIGVISWSWWLVLLPEIIALALYLAIIILQLISFNKTYGFIKKRSKFDDLW